MVIRHDYESVIFSSFQLSVGTRWCNRDFERVFRGFGDVQRADRVTARIFNHESARAAKCIVSVVRAVSITSVSTSRGSRSAIVDANVGVKF